MAGPVYTRGGVLSAVFAAATVGLFIGIFAGERNGPEPSLFGIRPGELLLVAATVLLWLATYGLVKGADRNAARQLRAYVSATPDFIFAFDHQSVARAKFKLKNTGITPARDLRHRGTIIVVPATLAAGQSFPELTSDFGAKMVLFPSVEFSGNIRADRIFTADEILSLGAGTHTIYVYGEVLYDDGFGEDRYTRFCTSIRADQETMKKLCTSYEPSDLKIGFETAPMGNTAS